ncbi:MAG: acetate kinase [Chloroflexales bacterium]|nr:acetate kinase [Chloroflexales bacterium]
MGKSIVVLNAGSSSIKFEVFDTSAEAALTRRFEGLIEGIGTAPRFVAKDPQGQVIHETSWATGQPGTNHAAALEHLVAWLDPQLDEAGLLGVGHRVVHGGLAYSEALVIDEAILNDLERFVPLAPLHQPHNLAGIRAAAAFLRGVPQVACFDTAFHRRRPPIADRFAIPDELHSEGVQRYGFHGLSYEYVAGALAEVAPEIAGGRVVVAHLGNGASMCAIRDGRAVDSTMGFTALDGLPMGTRCGAIDPGVLLYLMQEHGMDRAAIEALLYKRSGLLGISGVSNDMRELQASAEPRAALAIDYFVYRIGRELGALAATMGGLDGLIFTAGIGENAAEIRARVCRDAAWLGVELDEAANRERGPRISTAVSRTSAWVIPTDEELQIARHTLALLS